MNHGTALQIQPYLGVPIYRQISDHVQQLVANGTLEPGQELPSIPEMAIAHQVSRWTIAKAYRLLEANGMLTPDRDETMVSSQTAEQQMALIRPALIEVVSESRQFTVPDEELLQELENEAVALCARLRSC